MTSSQGAQGCSCGSGAEISRVERANSTRDPKRKTRLSVSFFLEGADKIDVSSRQDRCHGPSGPRRFCGVQAFWPKAKTLAQGQFTCPEHLKSTGWRSPPAAGTQKRRARCKIDLLQNEMIQKLSPIAGLAIGDNFFDDSILRFRLKTAFCNRPFFIE